MYYTYMIRCSDNSIYTGITTDPERRFGEHVGKSKNGAKYTMSHDAVKIEALWSCPDRATASRLEYRIKKLTKQKKEQLIKIPDRLEEFIVSENINEVKFLPQ